MASERRADDKAFPQTRWSLLEKLQAGEAQSLEALCKLYRGPILHYMLALGCPRQDVEDLTHDFFSDFIVKQKFQRAQEERGRLRTFLRIACRNFLHNARRSVDTAKRGGDQAVVALQDKVAASVKDQAMNPELEFDRHWAAEVMSQVLERMRRDYAARGKGGLFDAIRPTLVWDSQNLDECMTKNLGLNRAQLALEIHRLRERFPKYVRAVVAGTVEGEPAVDEEVRYLCCLFAPNA